jgi:hypothetical protein
LQALLAGYFRVEEAKKKPQLRRRNYGFFWNPKIETWS